MWVLQIYGQPHPDPLTHMKGACSVSVHPAAWTRIARLGGGIWTSLYARDVLRFVDFYAAIEHNRDEILAKGFAGNLITEATFWKSFHADEDGEDECFMLHATKEAAEAEDGVRDPESIQAWNSTEMLSLFWDGTTKPIGPEHTLDALVAYLAQENTEIDGVWWNDTYDPDSLSAPRGGIFQDRIPRLSQAIIEEEE